MNPTTAAAAFILLFAFVTLFCLCRAAGKPPAPRHPLYDGPCPAGQAARYGECWSCMNRLPHPSPAHRVCLDCGRPDDERYHNGITGNCLGDWQ